MAINVIILFPGVFELGRQDVLAIGIEVTEGNGYEVRGPGLCDNQVVYMASV